MALKFADKPNFSFLKGLVTEISPLAQVEGSALDMDNVILSMKGNIRRRPRLAVETGAPNPRTLPSTITKQADQAVSYKVWENPGNGKVYIFIQVGLTISLYEEGLGDSLFDGYLESFDLSGYLVDSSNADYAAKTPVSWAAGDGRLFVASKYIDTLMFKLDSTLNYPVIVSAVEPYIREYRDVEDGVDVTTQPDTLTSEHEYNLRIRGWPKTRIDAYKTNKGVYPSKNITWWSGFRRVNPGGSTIYGADWTKQWAASKIVAEEYGTTSAARGGLIINLYDQSRAPSTDGNIAITDVQPVSAGSPTWRLRITTDTAHGLAVNDPVYITGKTKVQYSINLWYYTTYTKNIDGSYTVKAATTNTVDIDVQFSNSFYTTWYGLVSSGTLGTGFIDRPGTDIINTKNRADVCAFYAGRLFLAGIEHEELSDKIYFSQVIFSDQEVSRFYQDADPTTETRNAIVATDGGYFQIPGLAKVLAMEPVGSSLVIFAKSGIWSISGGNEPFAANNIVVTKVSNIGCVAKDSIVTTEQSVLYVGENGIYAISPSTNDAGQQIDKLSVVNITEFTIDTLFNSIPVSHLPYIQGVYDKIEKKVYFLTNLSTPSSGRIYDKRNILVFDTRLQAWYKFSFDNPAVSNNKKYEIGGLVIPSPNSGFSDLAQLKVILRGVDSSSGLDQTVDYEIYDFGHDRTSYIDEHTGTEKIPYATTGYDFTGDFQRQKQTPYVFIYTNRTETGTDSSGNPLNKNSVMVQGRWNWSDSNVSGKWGNKQQAYRPRKVLTTPNLSSYDNGEPVVVTKLMIPGMGKVINLHFEGEAGKDFDLLGWSSLYSINSRV